VLWFSELCKWVHRTLEGKPDFEALQAGT